MNTENSSSHQTNLNCENVTQKIQVEKQVVRCIINLNTTVHTKISKHRKCGRKHRSKKSEGDRKKQEEEYSNKKSAKKKCKHNEKDVNRKRNKHKNKERHFKHPSQNRTVIERIVPCCSRSACRYYHEYRKIYRNKIHDNFHMKCEDKNEVKHKELKIGNHHHHHSHHNHHHKNRYSKPIKQTKSRILLSPLSRSPQRDVADTALEDISDTSLDVYIKEKPATYKRHPLTVTRESKLDTLIKRTKERERKLVEQSRQNHKSLYTSTPNCSADFLMDGSDMDISFNSLSTLVLETNSVYSPMRHFNDLQNANEDILNSNEDFQNPNKDLHNPNKDLHNPNKDLHNPNEDLQNPNKDSGYVMAKGIKKEIILKSEPQNNDSHSITKGIKREIILKSEPMLSCESPIYFDNKEDKELKFYKIENVKSELDC